MSDLFAIGLHGVIAFQQAMAVTGQNMANAKTPFYSRREVMFAEEMFYNGVTISDVRRIYDASASQYLQQASSSFELNNIYVERVTELEALLGDNPSDQNKNTIGVYINDAIKALRELNGNTSSIQARQIYLDKLTALSNRFNAISNGINLRQTNNNIALNTMVGEVNQITTQIANLNQQITNAGNLGQDVAALMDLREAQVQELAKYMDIQPQTDGNGTFRVLMSNGASIVMGDQSYQLSTVTDPANPANLLINLTAGAATMDVTHSITNGKIAGIYQAQSTLYQSTLSLGQLSLGIMGAFNAQNKLGINYNGALGGDIFTDINSNQLINDRVLTNDKNTGSANLTVNITDITSIKASDYQLVFTTSTHYTLTRLSDNTVVGSGSISTLPQQISADGFTININSGSINAGDQFTISPDRGAASAMSTTIGDPKLLALGWPVDASASQSNGGKGVITVDSIIDTTNSAFSIPGQLNPPIIIQFLTATSYQLVNANNSSVIEGPITYNPATGATVFPTPGHYDPGYRVSLSGIIQAGDTFNINYNTNGKGDNRNGLVMESLYQQGILNGGSVTFSQAYREYADDIARQVNTAKTTYGSSKTLMEQALFTYMQISQVDPKEEAINLASYQECFQACSQILQVAKNVFDTIASLGRR